MWCVLFGGGGEDVLIPIEVYSVYTRGPLIQKFEDGTDRKTGTCYCMILLLVIALLNFS